MRLAIGSASAKDYDFSDVTLREEKVTVGGSANFARRVLLGRIQIHFESGGGLRPRISRPGDYSRAILGRVRCKRLRQIGGRDAMPVTWLFRFVTGECSRAGPNVYGVGTSANDFCAPRSQTENGNGESAISAMHLHSYSTILKRRMRAGKVTQAWATRGLFQSARRRLAFEARVIH
jgi:hypothetical protein